MTLSQVQTIPPIQMLSSIKAFDSEEETEILPHHKYKLWFGEKAFLCASELGYMSNFAMTVQYKQKYTKAALSYAMRQVILKHSVFAYGFFRDGGDGTSSQTDERYNGENITKRPIHKITFDNIFEFRRLKSPLTVDDLGQLNSHTFPIGNGLPTYKCVIHEFGSTQYLSFISEHALRDGNSALFFHQDFLEELRSCPADATFAENLFVYDHDKSMLKSPQPPLDKLSSVLLTPYIISLLFFKHLIGFANDWTRPIQKFHVKPIASGYSSKFRHFNIPAEKLDKILSFVRERKITLTPYISVVGHQAFQETIISEFPGEFSSNLRISIDARRYFPECLDELRYAVCVGSHGSVFPPSCKSNEGILSTVKSVQLQLQKTLETPLFYAERALLKLVNIWTYFKGVEGTIGHLENFCVSNLGVLPDNSIVDSWFSQDCNAFAHMIVSIVSTPAGGLNVVVSFHDYLEVINSTGESSIDRFMSMFEAVLVNLS